MTVEITSGNMATACTIMAAFLAAIRWSFHGYVKAHRAELASKDEAQQTEINRLKENMDASWKMVDKLKEDRGNLWTRSDHQAWETMIRQDNRALREEIRADMKQLGDQLISRLEGAFAGIDPLIKKCLTCKGG